VSLSRQCPPPHPEPTTLPLSEFESDFGKAVLYLQRGVTVGVDGGLETAGSTYVFEGQDALVVRSCVGLMDEAKSLAVVAQESDVSLDVLRPVALELYRNGLLAEDGDAAIDPVLFYDHVRTAALVWRESTTNALPNASEGSVGWLALGSLLEHWQYVKTAPARLRLAARAARLAEAKALWARIAVQEEGWSYQLAGGLRRAMSDADLARARPLVATTELCRDMARSAAARRMADQLGYAARIGAGFAAEEADAGLRAYYEQLRQLHVLPDAVLEPFLRYADAVLAHAASDPIRSLFAGQRPLERDQRRVVIGHVAQHVRTLAACQRATFAFYASTTGPNLGTSDRRPLARLLNLLSTRGTSWPIKMFFPPH